MPAPFRIYSASAGSGKTYQLTKEYLKLALGYPQPADPTGERVFDPSYFKRILAITFTNDAAGEMKERIVGALRRFAQDAQETDGAADALLSEVTAELAAEGQLSPHRRAPADWQAEVRTRAAATFRLVLYHYADFGVSTIDAFVQRIVTAFTRELGLPASFEVELDSDSVLRAAVAALLDRVNRDPQSQLLSQTLADYALERAEEGRSWNQLPDGLLEFGRHLFSENVHEAVAQLSQKSMGDFRTLDQDIRVRLADIETAFGQVRELAVAQLAEAGVSEEDLYRGAQGIGRYVQKGVALLQPDADPNSYVQTTLNEDKWYGGKLKTAADRARVDAIKAPLTQLAATIAALRAEYVPKYLLLSAIRPHLFHASLLSELNKLVEEISRERNVVLISEFNRRIATIVLREPVPFIYEKLGEKYRHLLIDEFQDTSVLQWNNLLPLVENAVGNGGLSLAVGDAKQAIYRWRGGELEQILRLYQGDTPALAVRARDAETRQLLASRYQTLQGALEPHSLAVNYRSAAEIVAFNNDFFTYVRERHAGQELVAGIFEAGFRQVLPAPAPGPLPATPSPNPFPDGEGELALISSSSSASALKLELGLVPPSPSGKGARGMGFTGGEGAGAEAGTVEFLFTHDDAPARPYAPATGAYLDQPLPGYPPEATLDYEESTCYLALALVEQALTDGYSLSEVAVLCRTRDQSRRLAKFLKERGFAIISADSLALQFAEVVNLLVAVMRVLHQPADTLARAEALLLLDRVVRHLPPTPARARHIAEVANAKKTGKPFFDELRRLGFDVDEENTGNLGLYELTENLIGTFGLLGANAESDYLFRFLDLTLEFSLKFGNNLGNFLTHWDERKDKLSINAPGGAEAITITTVHKAKGLAYGIVIVPFADWSLTPHLGTLLWGRLDAADKHALDLPGLPDVTVVRLNQSTLSHTVLAGQDTEERAKTLLDGLNTLYVAFTRPRHRLYILSKTPPEPRKTTASKPDELPLAPIPEPAAAQGPARDVAALLQGYLRHLGHWQAGKFNYQLAMRNEQLIMSGEQLITSNQQSAINNKQLATSNEQLIISNEQLTESKKQETRNKKQETELFPLTNLGSTPWPERLRLRRHATTVFDFDEQERQGELNRKLHYALRRLLSADELPRVLRQLAAEGLINQQEKPALEAALLGVLRDERLAPYFAPGLAVETEREILVGGHTHRAYKPDRLVFGPGQSRAEQAVTMLDFKLPPPQESHRQRLRDYGALFRELGYGDVRGVIYYFGSGEVVRV